MKSEINELKASVLRQLFDSVGSVWPESSAQEPERVSGIGIWQLIRKKQ